MTEYCVQEPADLFDGGINEFIDLARLAFGRAGCDLTSISGVTEFNRPDEAHRKYYHMTADRPE